MSEISASAIGTMRYAVGEAATIRAYNYNGVEGMTLARLIMAFSFRRAAQTEQTCVNVMNQLALETDRLTDLSNAAKFLLADGKETFGRWEKGKWTAADKSGVRDFLVRIKPELDKSLPAKLGNEPYKVQMAAWEQIRTLLIECNASNELTTVELQTAVNRRDVVYNTVSSTITGLGKSSIACAMKLK